jgi:hypothetical protein
MAFSPNEIAERMRLAGEEWSDLDCAANLLEESRKSVLAELVNQSKGSSIAAKESEALADPAYKLHITNMVNARRDANRARVRYDTAKAWVELVRTSEATKRQEMRG